MGCQCRIWFLLCPHQVSECSGDRDNDEWHMSGEVRRVCSDGWWSEYCDMRLTGHGTTLEHHADHWQVANKKRINGLCNPPLSCSLKDLSTQDHHRPNFICRHLPTSEYFTILSPVQCPVAHCLQVMTAAWQTSHQRQQILSIILK